MPRKGCGNEVKGKRKRLGFIWSLNPFVSNMPQFLLLVGKHGSCLSFPSSTCVSSPRYLTFEKPEEAHVAIQVLCSARTSPEVGWPCSTGFARKCPSNLKVSDLISSKYSFRMYIYFYIFYVNIHIFYRFSHFPFFSGIVSDKAHRD